MIAATVCTTAILAQSERGTISGTVLDGSGAVVPGAKITLTNSQTGVAFSLPSNASGEFTVPQLPVGTYTVRFEKEGFSALWASSATVRQALRPYPQFGNIDTAASGGDHSGHSTYHAGMIRLEKRYSSGIHFLTSYVLSKLLTDADGYWPGGAAMDPYNRQLEKSIGQFDVT